MRIFGKVLGLSIISSALFSSMPLAQADLHECNGVWSNQPCAAGQPSASLPEETFKARSQTEVDQDKKQLWLHELETRRIKARSEFAIDLDVATVRVICEDRESSLLDCRKVIDEKSAEIDRKISLASERKLKVAELEERKRSVEDNQTQVNIIEGDDIIVIPGRNRIPRRTPHSTMAPSFKPDYASIPTIKPLNIGK